MDLHQTNRSLALRNGQVMSSTSGFDTPSIRDLLPNLGPFDRLWTLATGRPRTGTSPLFRSTPWTRLASTLLLLFGGVAISVQSINLGGTFALMLPIGWLLTVSGARRAQIEIYHHCVHGNFCRVKWIDRLIGETISLLLVIQSWNEYRHDHVTIHHSHQLATLDDPDLKFLIMLGFRPKRDRLESWRRLFSVLFSFRLDAYFLYFRLRSNLWSPPAYRKLLTLIVQGSLLFVVNILGLWTQYLVAWIFPLTLLYHRSALLQFISEHHWMLVRQPQEKMRVYLARLTSARFMGSAPPTSRSVRAWIIWWMQVPWHLFTRFFVIVGDMPNHDWHHIHARGDWPNSSWERLAEVESGARFSEHYTEIWGLLHSIDLLFISLETLPELTGEGDMSYTELADVLGGM